MAQTLQAAAKLMDEAKKKGTKGLFNWNPEYDDAGDLYAKAATIYRNNSAMNEALKAYELSAEMFEKADHLGIAAKTYDTAGQMLLDANKVDKAWPLMEKSAKYYVRDNKAQMASTVLVRTARALLDTEDQGMKLKAVELLNQGITWLENDDKHVLTKDIYRTVVLALIRAGKPLDAIAALKKQIATLVRADNQDQVAKNSLEIIIISLSLGDGVLANRYMTELTNTATGFSGSEEFMRASDLVSAFDDRDQDRLAEVGKAQLFTFLIPEISRLAKKLKVQAGSGSKKAGGAARNEDEDDDIR